MILTAITSFFFFVILLALTTIVRSYSGNRTSHGHIRSRDKNLPRGPWSKAFAVKCTVHSMAFRSGFEGLGMYISMVIQSRHAAVSLGQDGQFSSIQSFAACAVEMNLAWNLTERERLPCTMILQGNWGGWHSYSNLFFASSGVSLESIECVAFTGLSQERKTKQITHLKGFGSRS